LDLIAVKTTAEIPVVEGTLINREAGGASRGIVETLTMKSRDGRISNYSLYLPNYKLDFKPCLYSGSFATVKNRSFGQDGIRKVNRKILRFALFSGAILEAGEFFDEGERNVAGGAVALVPKLLFGNGNVPETPFPSSTVACRWQMDMR
jgi:hypothetical protein